MVNKIPHLSSFKIIVYDAPSKLYEGLINTTGVVGIYFCSPWITELGLPGFIELLKNKTEGKIFEILTRPPTPENPRHEEMLISLHQQCNAQIFANPILHAKLYVIIARIGSFAIFGSPNLTKTARNNLEIAVITHDDLFISRLFNVFQIYLKPLCKRWR